VSHGAEVRGHTPQRDPAGTGALGLLDRAMAWLNDRLLLVSMLALIAAAMVLTLSVVTRYFLKVATDWQDEASVFLMVFATFACGAYVQSYRGHVGIAAVASILSPRANRIRLAVSDLVSLLFCAFFAWKSWSMFHEALEEHQTTSSSWGPPLWIPYSAMALGMTLLALQLALQLAGHFRRAEAMP
jgi:TRAP-type C4-dicarboxylate transport system permease small subunit